MQTIKKTSLIVLLLFVAKGCATAVSAADADSLLKQGEEAFRVGDFDTTVRCCTDAIRLNPDFAAAYYYRGLAYGRKGNFDKAITNYSETIRLKPDFDEAYYGRGIAYKEKGSYGKAIADYTKVIRLKPDCIAAYYGRGTAYGLKGDTTKREADFACAHRLQAEYPGLPRIVAAISAPIVYKELMLIVDNEDGIAAIVFPKEVKYGVKYRYRYLTKHGKEESGEGEVSEKHKRLSSETPGEAAIASDQGKLSLNAGPLHLIWSFAEAGRGYVYYHPELVRVQIANAADFETIDLNRFRREKRKGNRH